MKFRCCADYGNGSAKRGENAGHWLRPKTSTSANRFDPPCASVCSPENPEMIGIAGKEWQVNQKASKLRIYTLKTQMGNNFDYFNIYCTQIFASLSVFTNITFLGVPSSRRSPLLS
jgi:hypothetical protein